MFGFIGNMLLFLIVGGLGLLGLGVIKLRDVIYDSCDCQSALGNVPENLVVNDTSLTATQNLKANIERHYRDVNFAAVVRFVTTLANEANKYLQDEKPWDVAKTNVDGAVAILTAAISVGKACIGLLAPIIPEAAAEVALMINLKGGFNFDNAIAPLPAGVSIKAYQRLIERLDVTAMNSLRGS